MEAILTASLFAIVIIIVVIGHIKFDRQLKKLEKIKNSEEWLTTDRNKDLLLMQLEYNKFRVDFLKKEIDDIAKELVYSPIAVTPDLMKKCEILKIDLQIAKEIGLIPTEEKYKETVNKLNKILDSYDIQEEFKKMLNPDLY